jgi:hypothetical protein
LIGVSFTSAVGYRSVMSDKKSSPLFNIRSSRAIDGENEDLSCEYVGKGNGIDLLIPDTDNELELLRKVLEIIQSMDDETFYRFINLCTYRTQQRKEFKDVSVDEVITALSQIHKNQEVIINYNDNVREFTWREGFIPTICWFPGCSIIATLLIVGSLISSLYALIFFIFIIITDSFFICFDPVSLSIC